MDELKRMQHRYRVTGDDFKTPPPRGWLSLLAAVVVAHTLLFLLMRVTA